MSDLLRLVPQVLRARGWRLYTKKGRLIDLWQYGGRAILGHNPPGLIRAFKNNGERGLFAPFPHFAEDRFLKALSALLPERSFRLYDSEASLYRDMHAAGLTDQSPSTLPMWRPFLTREAQETLQTDSVCIPVLPCAFPGAPVVLAFDPVGGLPEKLSPERVFSPVVLAAAARCVYDLLAVPERGNPQFHTIFHALKKNTLWKRQGIYLYAPPAHYEVLFRRFLEGGFLLPPSPEEPAILPGELSPGEEAKLAKLLQ